MTREARRLHPGGSTLEFCLAECIMEGCQRLPFRSAPRRGNWDLVQSPDVTLASGGDCDELSVLCVAADSLAGLESRLLWLVMPPGSAEDHVLPEVLVGGRWYYQETTVPGARLGEHPAGARERLAREAGLVEYLSGARCECLDGPSMQSP